MQYQVELVIQHIGRDTRYVNAVTENRLQTVGSVKGSGLSFAYEASHRYKHTHTLTPISELSL